MTGDNSQCSQGEEDSKGNPIRLSLGFSAEALKARGEWNQILKLLQQKNCHPIIMYPAEFSFRYEEEIKTFPDLQKLRESTTRRPPLWETLEGVILPKTKNKRTQNYERDD